MNGPPAPAQRPASPRWLRFIARLACYFALSILFTLAFLRPYWGPHVRGEVIATALMWNCGLIAITGLAGAAVTSSLRWLWLVALGAALVVIEFLVVLSRFNWGMG